MERGRISHSFIGFDEDTNDEPPFFEDNFSEHFVEPIEHFEEPPEFASMAPVREKYEYQSSAPFKRPTKLVANWNDMRNTSKRVGNHEMKSRTVDDSHQVRMRGVISSRQMESEKRRNNVHMGEMYDVNPKQARDFHLEREVHSKKPSVRTVSYKHEMKNPTSTKRARDISPCNSFVEARPAKMPPPLLAGTGENDIREKDKYLSTARSGQPQYGARSTTNPNKQSAKEDQHFSKSKQPEKQILSSDEIIMLREALEKSKTVSNRLGKEFAKHEHLLVQSTQSRDSLQKQIMGVDRENHKCTTDFHHDYCTARNVLKIQNQFHENVELLAGYLNNKDAIKETIASSTSASSWAEFQGTLKFYRKSRDEMKPVKQSCHELYGKLNKSIEKTSIDNVMESNLKQLSLDVNEKLVFCRGKRTQSEMMHEKTREDIVGLNAEIERLKAIANTHNDHKKAKFVDFFKKVKLETELTRQRKNLLNDQAVKQIAKQQEVIISLSNASREVVAEIEQLSAENRDLDRDTNAVKSKRLKVDEEYRSINSEYDKFSEKSDTSRGQANSKTRPMKLQFEIKYEKFRELKFERRQFETKKLHFVKKLEHFREVDEYVHKKAESQEKLMAISQVKKTKVELIFAMKRTQQEKEMRIRIAKEKAVALAEKRRELLEQLNARNDLLKQEIQAQVGMLTTWSCIKGEQSITREVKLRELSSMEKQVLGKLYSVTDLELENEQMSKENKYRDNRYRTWRQNLVTVMCEKERTENEIRMIKKFVKDKLYTTVQEINRNSAELAKRKAAEELALNQVEEYLNEQKMMLDHLKKTKNLNLSQEKCKLADDE